MPTVSCSRSSEKLYSPERGHHTGSIGCTDAIISDHESQTSLEIDPHLSLGAVEQAYQEAPQGVSI